MVVWAQSQLLKVVSFLSQLQVVVSFLAQLQVVVSFLAQLQVAFGMCHCEMFHTSPGHQPRGTV